MEKRMSGYCRIGLTVVLVCSVLFSSIHGNYVFAKTKVRISKKKIVLQEKRTRQLSLRGISRKNRTKIKWRSSKRSVAVVSKKGKVKAIKTGKAKIIAKYKNKRYVCRITVKAKKTKNSIIPSSAGTEIPTAMPAQTPKPSSVPEETSPAATDMPPAVTPSPSPDVDSVITPSPLPDTDSAIHNSVTDYVPNTVKRETIYLYEMDNIPAVTKYYQTGSFTQDPEDFIPHMTFIPVRESIPVKGAVLVCAGGAFQFRSDEAEGYSVANTLSSMGYQSFVVDYRIRPYTQEEGALDLARAVRFVRMHAAEYGIEENDIAVMGFSAGGILCGEMLLNYDGLVNGSVLDSHYRPDVLDSVSADASAVGMIYSFYGRLSVASTNTAEFATSDLPPAYFCYGTRDPFVSQFARCAEALQSVSVPVEVNVLQDMPHGYGSAGGWMEDYDRWLTDIFQNNMEGL